jgi:flagellar biosynthetic protein FlhB
MSGEKTEKPTSKKIQDARKEGNVLKSTEINNVLTLFASLMGLSLLWPGMFRSLKGFFSSFFNGGYDTFSTLDEHSLHVLLLMCGKAFFSVAAPLLLLLLVVGMAVNFLQVGILFTPKALKPKMERVSFSKGLKRIFSITTVKNLVKSFLKIFATVLLGYLLLKPLVIRTVSLLSADLPTQIEFGASNMIRIGKYLLMAMAGISVIDYAFSWFEHQKKLKMSKQEIKDEHKSTEGNPEIKSRIRSTQQKFAQSRMMQQVPRCDVVITNPTHYAVAILYEQDKSRAPLVVAKGTDLMALKIKEIAKKNKIEIVESRQLARSLYSTTEPGQEIPLELFQAVAEILAYIYALKKKKRRSRL